MIIKPSEPLRVIWSRMLSGVGIIGVEVGLDAVGGYNPMRVMAYIGETSCRIMPKVWKAGKA